MSSLLWRGMEQNPEGTVRHTVSPGTEAGCGSSDCFTSTHWEHHSHLLCLLLLHLWHPRGAGNTPTPAFQPSTHWLCWEYTPFIPVINGAIASQLWRSCDDVSASVQLLKGRYSLYSWTGVMISQSAWSHDLSPCIMMQMWTCEYVLELHFSAF